MDSGFLALVLVVLFLGVIAGGHRSIARGANREVANGVVLVALAVILGLLLVASLAPYL